MFYLVPAVAKIKMDKILALTRTAFRQWTQSTDFSAARREQDKDASLALAFAAGYDAATRSTESRVALISRLEMARKEMDAYHAAQVGALPDDSSADAQCGRIADRAEKSDIAAQTVIATLKEMCK